MNASQLMWARLLMWAAAIVLFVLGGYSDNAIEEMWGWGFALLTGGMLIRHLPGGDRHEP